MIFDTGIFVGAANTDDPDHEACVELLSSTRLIRVPSLVIAEAGFLIAKIGGSEPESKFLRSLTSPRFGLVTPSKKALDRAADLVRQYANLPLGTTDAVIMAIAEEEHDPRVATLDQRHFTIVRPLGFSSFEIVPALEQWR